MSTPAIDCNFENPSQQAVSCVFGPSVAVPFELLHHAFEARARSNPQLRVIEFQSKWLTFGQLNSHADNLAWILSSLGVSTGVRVGVVMERCLEFPIGLLAVLKAGGSMMPLDATFPAGRLKFMLVDANASIVVTTENYRTQVEALDLKIPVVYVDSNQVGTAVLPSKIESLTSRFDEAYVVYTSGSTGKPKGVPVLHGGIVNTIHFSSGEMFAEGQRVAQMFSIAFDGCQLEIWCALSNGATLVFRGDDIFETLRTVDSSPTTYSNLKFVAVGGEPISTSLKDLWAPYVTFVNKYGPTECAAETHEANLDADAAVTVGAPLPNVNCYILDDDMLPVPVGQVGEIFLGGICVSPGYINLPDQTAERFVDDPFLSGEARIFRTGDFGRLLPTGHFEVHGRKDSQVKLRGYRIELEEISEAMMRHPQVTAAAPIVKDKSHLVGYFTPSNVDIDELRNVVASFVPEYMTPSAWIGLESMPQNVNGKIDRKALVELDVVVPLESLVSETEVRLAKIWADVLCIDIAHIGRQTSFYSLGGDSLSMILVAKRCGENGLQVSALQLAKEPFLWRAALLLGQETNKEWPAVSLPNFVHDEIDIALSGVFNKGSYTVNRVTSLQAGMIFENLQSSSAFVIQETLALDASVDVDWLCQCVQQLAQRYDVFQSTFVPTQHGIFQVYLNDELDFKIEHVSVRSYEEFLTSDASRGFVVGQPFARCSLVTELSKKYLVITMHHSLTDGWTSSLLVGDLMDAYFRKPLPSRPSFRTVIDYIEAQEAAASEAFWRSYLNQCVPTTIGTSIDRHEILENTLIEKTVPLPMHVIADTAKLAGVTVADFTKLAWAATLRKFTRSNDVLFGQVVSNRTIPVGNIESILGAMISTIPFRVKFNDDLPLQSFMASLQEAHTSMLPFSYSSLADMKHWTKAEDGLFDTVFTFQNFPSVDLAPGFQFNSIEYNQVDTSRYTLEVILEPRDDILSCVMNWNPRRIDVEYAHIILEDFLHTIDQLQKSLTILPPSTLNLWELSPAHKCRLREASFGPIVPLPYELLHHGFEERAAAKPKLLAVEYEGQSITYGELNELATTLAHELVSLGVGVGRRVAVVMERCLEFPIGLLAVLKSGGSMMPLDATFPSNRLTFMLADASVAVVVTTEAYRAEMEALMLEVPVVYFSSTELAASPKTLNCTTEATRNDEAFVVYTSGSTGRPKGVPICHGGAVNTIASSSKRAYGEGFRVAQVFAIAFDVCQLDMWCTLSTGGCLVLRGDDLLDAVSTVDTFLITPTALAQMGTPELFPNLKFLGVAGEPLPSSLKDLWASHVSFVNKYGPAECAMLSHESFLDVESSVHIGKPYPNINCYILDDAMRQVPVGVVGEVYLGGICVSPGYINLPKQTAERFLDDPFVSGGRTFRTGDYGRLLPNGNFEILGRKDNQVKLKGYRIELEEIGEVMMRHPQVTSAAAIVKDKTHLVGYFTPPTVNVDELRSLVSSYLPLYMVPAVWMGLPSMPLNVNGKTDRLALENIDVVVNVESLETEIEIAIATVWSRVLNIDLGEIGRNSSFFALGGDSISAIRLVAKAKQAGLILTSSLVMKHSTLEAMARVVKQEKVESIANRDDVHGVVPLTPTQHWTFGHPWKNINFWNLSMTLKPRSLLRQSELEDAVSKLIAHHDMLRARFSYSAVEGWSQYVLEKSEGGSPNVHFISIGGFEDLRDAVLQVEGSLNLIDGPLYAVTVFETSDNVQYLQFTAHHTIMDLVSWRVLIDDLESLLMGRQMSTKSMSFRQWSKLLSAKALEWDASAWNEYMCDDVIPPTDSSHISVDACGVLNEDTSSKLDLANAKYGTNIQELALAALTGSLAELRTVGQNSTGLAIMLEGHGRETWSSDIDTMTTVGWFTCEYPVMFTASDDIGDLLRQVKHKIRAVPHKGLSYGAIKYLVPTSESTERIKSHRQHNIAFNYLGRFQETNSDNGVFEILHGIDVPQFASDEVPLWPGSLSLSHNDGKLVLFARMENWLFSAHELEAWMELWTKWMNRIVEHCLDSTTLGGRILYDLPLLGSMSAVNEAETELFKTLGLRPSDVDDIYPATPLQSGFIWAMLQDPSEYVMQSSIDILGDFAFSRFKSCWNRLAHQTDILRTVFVSTSHGIFQAVTKNDLSEWQFLDEIWPIEELTVRSEAYFALDRKRGFSLQSRSFQRFCGVRLSDGQTRVFWTQHHSVADGWSIPILINNFLLICYGENAMLTSPFRNHIEWLTRQDPSSSKLFWRESLQHLDKTAPLVFPKPEESCDIRSRRASASASVHLPDLRSVCKRLSTTASTLFRVAWSIVLQQYTRRDYVKFGSVVSGRDTDLEGADQMIGVMINTVPVLVNVTPTLTVSEVISSVHTYSVELLRHAHYSLADIKSWSGASTTDDIFETILVYENYPSVDGSKFNGRPFSFDVTMAPQHTDATLSVAVIPIGEDYHFLFSYNPAIICPVTVRMFQDRFLAVIPKISSQSHLGSVVSDLDVPSEYEQSILKASCFGPPRALPYELLHHAFEERAEAKSKLLAVEYEGQSITYGELNELATTLAHELVSLGVGVGRRVAVVMERCLEFPIGLLAVLKSGGSMMPLDATFPSNRLTFMLADASVAVVVTTEAYRAEMEALKLEIPVVYFSSTELAASPKTLNCTTEATRHDEAYVVYTSGSTGKPKGVPVLHRGILNTVLYSCQEMFAEGLRVGQILAIGFDGFQLDMWSTLSHGATLVLRGQDQLNVLTTVDSLVCTPTALSLLGAPSNFPNFRFIAVAGEPISISLKNLWAPCVTLMNRYGPTECSVETHETILHTDTSISIGKPLTNINSYILDGHMRQVPVGVSGEIYLGGICVSPGYINLPKQTAGRFLDDPFVPDDQMFRTGDYGRLLPNGNFEVLGRKDSQVKLKGYRIELEEIGEAMMRHPQVTSAAAIVKDKTHLVGYFTPPTVDVDELRTWILSFLPVYMVPSLLIPLESMPQTSNGKIDRVALEATNVGLEVDILQTDHEKQMAAVWAQVLGINIDEIGRSTSFFAVGGDSISLIRLISVAKKRGFVLTASLVVRNATLKDMVRVMKPSN
ncbi:hypothetical protein AC1031_014020 [Aphanomyces cochlioides]|nr:hypothetical protein AC1031_014020 [Aphanomyces cochlioides]